MATKEQLSKEDEQFKDGFNEPETAPEQQDEDTAFGITPSEPGETEGSQQEGEGDGGVPPAVAIVVGAKPGEAEESPAEEAAETPAQEAQEQASGTEAGPGEDWEQKYKTLQGKYDAEVKGKGKGSSPDTEAGGEVAGNADGSDKAEGGMSAEEAMKKLSEDFGPDFVQMICAIAGDQAKQAAGEVAKAAVGEVQNDVQSVIAHLTDNAQKAHFSSIADKHPDFMEVDDSPEFKAWLASQPPEAQKQAEQILASGQSGEVVKLLDDFKASKQTAEPAPAGETADDAAAEAGEGVRSSGVQLPKPPAAGKNDYEAAWNEA